MVSNKKIMIIFLKHIKPTIEKLSNKAKLLRFFISNRSITSSLPPESNYLSVFSPFLQRNIVSLQCSFGNNKELKTITIFSDVYSIFY